MSRHLATKDALRARPRKVVAYFSAEFLIGPQLGKNLLMLGIREQAAEALRRFGVEDLDDVLDLEEEPGLGNGGLGRLAACFLESMATLELPATGYGIRYEFGIFDQMIQDGWQVEITDKWLKGGWPWEMVQPEKACRVGFGGETHMEKLDDGRLRVHWRPAEIVLGIPHDEYQFSWHDAWSIMHESISYTNHTLLPEALECWDLNLFSELLPRHLELIFEINSRFLQQVRLRHPGDLDLIRRVSIIGEDGRRSVRVAHLATIAAHHINGVAELHSQLIRTTLLADFASLFPDRFTNVTNGVTLRRWRVLANPPLHGLLQEVLGVDWPVRPEALKELEPQVNDGSFVERWAAVKQASKERLARLIFDRTGVSVDSSSLFDVQVKWIHEYKRQHLNALRLIGHYLRIRSGDTSGLVPRTVIFGCKAAPGYAMAKLIIRLINGIAAVVNNDPACRDLLQVVFLTD
jgi:glucan phosphorylase